MNSFPSKAHHVSAVYDACALIVNTYMNTDILDHVHHNNTTAYDFMKYAKEVLNQIAEDKIE